MAKTQKKFRLPVFTNNGDFCKYCDYFTSNKKDFARHLATRKHQKMFLQISEKNKLEGEICEDKALKTEPKTENKLRLEKFRGQIDNFSANKKSPKYACEHCSKEFPYHSWLCRHYMTCKAKKKPEFLGRNEKYVCELCSKEYKYRGALSKHYIKCSKTKKLEKNVEKNLPDDDESTFMKLLIENNQTNKKLCEKILQLETENRQIIQNNITNNRYQNNNLNINVFLNENCKDAMNITDFINQLQLSIDDLDYTRHNGYVKGISNIFIKNLTDMEPTIRPIHYNLKNPEFYIKDEGEWDIDRENLKLNETIDTVGKKQLSKIKEWESANPHWNKSEEGISNYMKMVNTIMGGTTEEERNKNRELIKTQLTETIEIPGSTSETDNLLEPEKKIES